MVVVDDLVVPVGVDGVDGIADQRSVVDDSMRELRRRIVDSSHGRNTVVIEGVETRVQRVARLLDDT